MDGVWVTNVGSIFSLTFSLAAKPKLLVQYDFENQGGK
jgi:hypothetical protein